MPLNIVDGPTIAAGELLSDGADCSAGEIMRITVPQEFTLANLTFQVSSDGNFYNDLFSSNGEEITVVAKPNTGIVVPEAWTKSINFIKFRSGTRGYPVPQKVECKFAIAVEAPGGGVAAASQRREPDPKADPKREAGR